MEKKTWLRVKRQSAKRNNRTFLAAVMSYLKSDTHMFGPLFSDPLESTFLSPKINSSVTTEMVEDMTKRKNKRLMNKVWEYLRADTYMYAPLVAARDSVFPKGVISRCTKRVATEISARKVVTTKGKQSPTSIEAPNVATEDHHPALDHRLPGKSVAEKQQLSRQEMVKHMVHQSCCRSSLSVAGMECSMVDPQIRKVVVD